MVAMLKRFISDEKGLETVEYAVMTALIVAALVTAITTLSAAVSVNGADTTPTASTLAAKAMKQSEASALLTCLSPVSPVWFQAFSVALGDQRLRIGGSHRDSDRTGSPLAAVVS